MYTTQVIDERLQETQDKKESDKEKEEEKSPRVQVEENQARVPAVSSSRPVFGTPPKRVQESWRSARGLQKSRAAPPTGRVSTSKYVMQHQQFELVDADGVTVESFISHGKPTEATPEHTQLQTFFSTARDKNYELRAVPGYQRRDGTFLRDPHTMHQVLVTRKSEPQQLTPTMDTPATMETAAAADTSRLPTQEEEELVENLRDFVFGGGYDNDMGLM